MKKENFSLLANWRYDLPASIVVFLVALPLCLGVALASGAPLFSGLISGIIGGVLVGALSKSALSISGPTPGSTVIVLAAIQQLASFEAFLLAVCIAGAIQIVFGILRAGVVGDFIPSAVIKGMLAAIGLILILKQIPHAIGYDADYQGDDSFWQFNGRNTFSALLEAVEDRFLPGAALISSISLVFLFWWDKHQPKLKSFWRYLPGPLVVVVFGILMDQMFAVYMPRFAAEAEHLVNVPVASSIFEFWNQFLSPDFTRWHDPLIWKIAGTLALVASIETLLSIEAVDRLDQFKRISPTSRELVVQGIGNITSGLLGGLPMTSVIVRGSANATAGARTKLSAILHGLMLLIAVALLPEILNMIPLSALAAVLIVVGYKLTKPAIFFEKYEKGWSHFIPFLVTISAIMLTDLLIGIGIGVAVGILYVLTENFRGAVLVVKDERSYLIRLKKDLFF